jgi:hypothetical protein
MVKVPTLSLFVLAALLMIPATAMPQSQPVVPTAYVCTPDGQILKVNGTAATVILSGGGAFDDCVFGPDGRVYLSEFLANDLAPNRIERLDPDSASPILEMVAALPSAPRGMAFNITTLYINTAASGVYALPGISLNHGSPFPQPIQVLSSPTTPAAGWFSTCPATSYLRQAAPFAAQVHRHTQVPPFPLRTTRSSRTG